MVRCVDCVHESQIDWTHGITELSGYCPEGSHYIKRHLNKYGESQSLHAQRKCEAFESKAEYDDRTKP